MPWLFPKPFQITAPLYPYRCLRTQMQLKSWFNSERKQTKLQGILVKTSQERTLIKYQKHLHLSCQVDYTLPRLWKARGIPNRTQGSMGFRAGQEQQRGAELVCSAEAHPQPPSVRPRPRRPHPGSHLGSHQGLRARRWPSITSGGGRSPAEWLESASWGPAMSRHLRKNRKPASPTALWHFNFAWFQALLHPLWRHFPKPHLLFPVPQTTVPSLSDTLRLSDQGKRYLPHNRGTKTKYGRLKLSKPHHGGLTAGPILDLKLPQTRKKSITTSPLTACPSVRRRPERN